MLKIFVTLLLMSGLAVAAPLPPKAVGQAVRADGGRGVVIPLRGVNLGGWLIYESWMCPMDSGGAKDQWSVRQILGGRFGKDKARELMDVYESHWLMADDFDRIKALGFTVVRLPFNDLSLLDDDGKLRPAGLARLDWAVRAASDCGLYTILDLHGAPGGQSTDHCTGRIREKAVLWADPAHRAATVALWQAVAAHFKGNAGVLAYDLLNEPTGAPDLATLWSFYDELYRAVRTTDPDHAITVEACWGGQDEAGRGVHWEWDVLPPPARFGWTNVIYQFHAYAWDWADDAKQRGEAAKQIRDFAAHKAWDVPCLLGETSVMAPKPDPTKTWTDVLQQYDAAGIGWCLWTYKSARAAGDDSWGIYNVNKAGSLTPDLRHDSADQIAAKWRRVGTAESFTLNPMIAPALKAAGERK